MIARFLIRGRKEGNFLFTTFFLSRFFKNFSTGLDEGPGTGFYKFSNDVGHENPLEKHAHSVLLINANSERYLEDVKTSNHAFSNSKTENKIFYE